ncbi:MAG: metal-sensing transcriptional repressor [Gammaproteobacteria bacterium]|jgi:DNA-binding FrmR family transcriptional regulator|nr:metal-sensing transcriptional repressor [Gammaproteobacteria bacterium]
MDNAVALVEANLRINGYFTVAEDPIKESLQRRLNRIEGQVRGIDRMIDEARYCIDILQQIQAIKSALARVEDVVLKDHAATRVNSAMSWWNSWPR